MKCRKKPVVVEAHLWEKNGDHPFDAAPLITGVDGVPFLGEGKVVRFYRTPQGDGQSPCKHCGKIMHVHGWIDTLEGGHIVCPGDFVMTGVKGERYPIKPNIFWETYDVVE